jgi:galactokinase
MLNEAKLSELPDRRCRFVIEENKRVEEMVLALSQQDAVKAGQLLKASHHGLQHMYEVSCEELDHLADIANNTEGVYGGRMMGGGFGGCVIYLVKEESMEGFLEKAIASYERRFGFKPEVIEFELDSGVSMIKPLTPEGEHEGFAV